MEFGFIQNLIDKIPLTISWIRNFLIDKIGLTEPSYQILVAVIAGFISFYWIKQFITYNVFAKVSSILNWLVLGFLIYVLLVYI